MVTMNSYNKSRVSVRQWRWFVDAIEQAAAQHGENGSTAVSRLRLFVGSTRFQTTCWRWVWTSFRPSVILIPWFWLIDADAPHTDCVPILQLVLNAATQLVLGSRKYDHVTPLLKDLHCLRVPERIAFRLAVDYTVVSMELLRHTWQLKVTVSLTLTHTLHDRRPFLSRSSRWSLTYAASPGLASDK